jgi:hypothetical protein
MGKRRTKTTIPSEPEVGSIPLNTTELIDLWMTVPNEDAPGYPDKLHLLFNRDAVEFSTQYRDALYVARGIPFSTDNITPADIMSLVVASTAGKKIAMKSEEAVRRAKQIYERWAEQAERDSWTLAILYDNEFDFQPKPFSDVKPKVAPGLPMLPEPKRDLADPVEFRLKQINDLVNVTYDFRLLVERTINDCLTKLAQFGEAVKEVDPMGFRPTTVDTAVSEGDGPVSPSN